MDHLGLVSETSKAQNSGARGVCVCGVGGGGEVGVSFTKNF